MPGPPCPTPYSPSWPERYDRIAVWDWLIILACYGFAALFLRLLGGFNAAADAIAGWGRRASLRRLTRLRWVPPAARAQRDPTTSS
jgi:hypothetical protein